MAEISTLQRTLALVLGVALLALGVTYLRVDNDPPAPAGKAPVRADQGEVYVPGSLPDDLDAAVEAAATAMPLALGYDYRRLAKGLDAATAVMTEDFAEEFRRTFQASAAELARKQKAVTTATVRAAGLVSTDDGHVLALVYVDQALVSSTTLEDEDAPVRVSQNRVLVGLTQEDGAWRVESIDPI
ncbi:hypothetical protein [Nocardioides stalactiti]|uniref:hypothetical protein n=1 Tax=Nocardioides stalactiti TaxID=2755356 RepID=UPI0016009782|nr:hypothetical protein [Nocardioides stalactiti]